MAMRDPVSCRCRTNACTRVRGREGDKTRGFCRCKENGTPCTYLCACGTGKYPCANQNYFESDEEDYREDADGTENELCDPLYVAFEQVSEVDEAGEKEPTQHKGRSGKAHHEKKSAGGQEINVTKRNKKSSRVSEVDEAVEKESTQDKGRSGKANHEKKSAGGQEINVTKRNKKSSEAQRRSEADLVKSQIIELTTDGIKNLVLKLADLYPDLVGMAIGPNPPEPPPHTGPDGWCKCYKCREMPTLIERQCCISTNQERCILITSAGPINQLVLSRTALEVAVLNHNEYCIQNDDPNDNNTLRHMAYRKYILWSRGYLGAGVRVVIPSCVVWAIRDKYPSADGTYTGYKPPHN